MRTGAIDEALAKSALLHKDGPKSVLPQTGIRQYTPQSIDDPYDYEEMAEADHHDQPDSPVPLIHVQQPSISSLSLRQFPESPDIVSQRPSSTLLQGDATPSSHTYPPPSPISAAWEPEQLYADAPPNKPQWSDEEHPSDDQPIPTWLGLDVHGDERVEGPIFNYARVFTWFQLAKHVRHGFSRAMDLPTPAHARTNSSSSTLPILDVEKKGRTRPLRTFGRLSEIDSIVFHHMLWASLVAIILQWGTTGAAIFTAYKTPNVGLGCHSGSYLIYGVTSTVCWLIFVVSGILSHMVMQYQEEHPDITMSTDSVTIPLRIRLAMVFAVCLRLLGRFLVIANAVWLISFSVMEDIGYYANCYCETLRMFTPESKGWAPVFIDVMDFKALASGVWSGGFTLSTTIFVGIGGFFYLTSTEAGQ